MNASAPGPLCGLAATDWARKDGVLTTQYNLQMQPVLHLGWQATGRYNGGRMRQLTEDVYYRLYHGQGLTRINNPGTACENSLSGGMPDTPADQLGTPGVSGIAIGSRPVPIRLVTTATTAPAMSLSIESGELSDTGSLGSPQREAVGSQFRYTWMYTPPASIGSAMPARLAVTATIPGQTRSASFLIYARPVVAVHGLWGSRNSFAAFERMFFREYPTTGFHRVHYGDIGQESFLDTRITQRIADTVQQAQVDARARGIAVGEVDIIAHSMGGPASAQYLRSVVSNAPWSGPNNKVIGRFVVIGSPMDGSHLASWLLQNRQRRLCTPGIAIPPLYSAACISIGAVATVEGVMANMGMPIGEAVNDLVPGSPALQQVRSTFGSSLVIASTTSDLGMHWPFRAISCMANTCTSINQVLGSTENDSIVSLASQTAAGTVIETLEGLAHSPIAPGEFDAEWTQLGSRRTVAAVAVALGRTEPFLAPRAAAPQGTESTPLQQLLSIDFSTLTKIDVTTNPVSPGTAPAFTAVNLSVANVPGCSLTQLYAYEPPGEAYAAAGSARNVLIGAKKPGTRQVLLVGLCSGAKYYTVSHTLTQTLPASLQLRFDPPILGPVALGSSLPFRVVADTGSAVVDVTADVATSFDSPVAALRPGPELHALRPGVSRLSATYGALSVEADVVVGDAAGIGLFSSGFD